MKRLVASIFIIIIMLLCTSLFHNSVYAESMIDVPNNSMILDEEYATSMLINVIETNDIDKIKISAEKIIKLFPDNEVARIALLSLNDSNITYVENYLKKYPNDIYGQYVYLRLKNAPKESYTPLIERVRKIYTEEEFYSIVQPTILLNITNIYNFKYCSKEHYLSDIFEIGVDIVLEDRVVVSGDKDEYILYSLPVYDRDSDTTERLNDYIMKHPPENFIRMRN